MRNPSQSNEQATNARRSGDRSDVAIEPKLTEHLAAEAIRLARLATSVHLAEQARLLAEADALEARSSSTRETVR